MRGQRFERIFENRTRQMWAVAIEGDDASSVCIRSNCVRSMTFREMRKHRIEARSESFAFLRNYAHLVARQARQFVYVRLRAHDRNFHTGHF
jgi:hypothetical protein